MTSSILKTAFENVRTHICNIDDIKELVQEIDSLDEPIDSIIKRIEARAEGAEATLRTDIRILINECRHLESKMTD
jgi:restriction endonuclease S subunit